MRLMLIDDDPRYRALLRHHITCTWPEARIVPYNPAVRGPLVADFLAQGFDVVLLDHSWEGGDGCRWLADLGARPGFAPILFLSPGDDPALTAAARDAGAFAVLPVRKIDHERLIALIKDATLLQAEAQANWRDSAAGREAQRFGGAHIPGYRRARKLASGSVSDLYLAESIEAGEMVALKVTRDARRADGVDQTFERFLQEYEIVRSVRHPHVVHIHDLGVTDDYAYLVMEYFARGDLRAQMRRGALNAARALRYAREIAEALDAIHQAGILHRDLKPGNVMIRDDGSLALIDFGLAKHQALKMEITDKGLIFGTPHYMSPEQGHGQPTDARSDLYALGVVLHELLTGAKPFEADNPMAIIYQHAKAPVPRLPAASSWLQPCLDRLLAKAPADRYGSAAEAERALDAALEEAIRMECAA
jgi:tRNA A-37 threonylcarbamoyl transferase component Bud32/DNA-binding NarL/FixJ family response regulator